MGWGASSHQLISAKWLFYCWLEAHALCNHWLLKQLKGDGVRQLVHRLPHAVGVLGGVLAVDAGSRQLAEGLQLGLRARAAGE